MLYAYPTSPSTLCAITACGAILVLVMLDGFAQARQASWACLLAVASLVGLAITFARPHRPLSGPEWVADASLAVAIEVGVVWLWSTRSERQRKSKRNGTTKGGAI